MFNIGDKVRLNERYKGRIKDMEKVFRVTSGIHGKWIYLNDGKYYPADSLTKVEA